MLRLLQRLEGHSTEVDSVQFDVQELVRTQIGGEEPAECDMEWQRSDLFALLARSLTSVLLLLWVSSL